MKADHDAARHLRQRITEVYLTDEPPPGKDRATWFTTALKREPDNVEFHRMARDFLAVIGLHARLSEALAVADDPETGLVLHGLVGHAVAELLGATWHPGWRAAALDVLDPDGGAAPPLDRVDMARLFALAMGLLPDTSDATD